jgi:hypothetical protein
MPSIINATTTTGLISSGDTSGSLQLATNNGTAAVTIDTSQNVGIGTTSPTATLDVTHSNGGSARIRGVSTDGARLQFFNNAATANGFFVGQGFSTGTDNVAYLSNQANADMIFRTNSAERMRIASDGYMYVGRTSDTDVAGLTLGNDGFIRVNRDGNAAIVANRNTNNGTLISFRRAGNTVGTVDVTTTGTTYTGTNGITFTASQTASADANTLDDYEEGSFTPTLGGSSTNPVYTTSVAQGVYTKIGRVVHFSILIIVTGVSSQGSGTIFINCLPFSKGADVNTDATPHIIGYNDIWDTAFHSAFISSNYLIPQPTGVTQAAANWGTTSSSASNLSTGYLGISGTYITS